MGFSFVRFLVAFVAGNDDDRAQSRYSPAGLQDVNRAHEIGRKRADGIMVRRPHYRLCRQMEDDFWRRVAHGGTKPVEVP